MVSDGEVLRGHAGLAGEIAHVVTAGPGGRAMRLTEVFEALGLRRPGSTAIDVPALLRAVESSAGTAGDLASAVAGVLSAAVALADPAVVLLGGPWGRDPPCSPRSRASSPGRRAMSRSKPPPWTTSRRWRGPARPRCEQLRDAIVTAASAS